MLHRTNTLTASPNLRLDPNVVTIATGVVFPWTLEADGFIPPVAYVHLRAQKTIAQLHWLPRLPPIAAMARSVKRPRPEPHAFHQLGKQGRYVAP